MAWRKYKCIKVSLSVREDCGNCGSFFYYNGIQIYMRWNIFCLNLYTALIYSLIKVSKYMFKPKIVYPNATPKVKPVHTTVLHHTCTYRWGPLCILQNKMVTITLTAFIIHVYCQILLQRCSLMTFHMIYQIKYCSSKQINPKHDKRGEKAKQKTENKRKAITTNKHTKLQLKLT